MSGYSSNNSGSNNSNSSNTSQTARNHSSCSNNVHEKNTYDNVVVRRSNNYTTQRPTGKVNVQVTKHSSKVDNELSVNHDAPRESCTPPLPRSPNKAVVVESTNDKSSKCKHNSDKDKASSTQREKVTSTTVSKNNKQLQPPRQQE